MKLFVLVFFISVSTLLNAANINSIVRNQCEYIVKNIGQNTQVTNFYMTGIIDSLMLERAINNKLSKNMANSSPEYIKHKACEKNLTEKSYIDITKSYGFKNSFILAVLEILETK
jgi:hypothetical protein